VQATPGFNLVVMNRVYLFASQEVRLLVPKKRSPGARLFSETAKEAGMQRARLAVDFFEPLS
jgi:hypothetical protein